MNDVTSCVLLANERASNLTVVVFQQVKLLAGASIAGEGLYPVKAPVVEGDLPINTNACGKYKNREFNPFTPKSVKFKTKEKI